MAQEENDEKTIVDLIKDRFLYGRKEYGVLSVKTDKRNFTKEALEEALDMSIYLGAKLVQLEREEKRKKELKRIRKNLAVLKKDTYSPCSLSEQEFNELWKPFNAPWKNFIDEVEKVVGECQCILGEDCEQMCEDCKRDGCDHEDETKPAGPTPDTMQDPVEVDCDGCEQTGYCPLTFSGLTCQRERELEIENNGPPRQLKKVSDCIASRKKKSTPVSLHVYTFEVGDVVVKASNPSIILGIIGEIYTFTSGPRRSIPLIKVLNFDAKPGIVGYYTPAELLLAITTSFQ